MDADVGGPEAAMGEGPLEGGDEGLAPMGPLELDDEAELGGQLRRARRGSGAQEGLGHRTEVEEGQLRGGPWSQGTGRSPRRTAIVGVVEG